MSRRAQRGSALVLVMGVVMIAAAVIAGLYIMLRTRIDDLAIASDRIKAQFLCEAGVSVAVLDMKHGRIGPPPGWTDRTFMFPVGDTSYRITYHVRKVTGVVEITSEVESPGGMGMTYTLKLGGRRAFPVFIWGMGSGL